MRVSSRQTELDILKLVAFVCVVGLHVAAKPWQTLPVVSWQWKTAAAFRGTWGVPVFVMISGRFLLDPERNVSATRLGKYAFRALAAFVFWSLLYEVYQLFVAYPIRGVTNIDCKWEITELVRGEYHLWYLIMLTGLYCVTPFLQMIARDRKLTGWYLILFVIFETLTRYGIRIPQVGVMITPVLENMHFQFAMGYSGYMMLGWWLYSTSFSNRQAHALYVAGFFCMLATPLADILYSNLSGERNPMFSNTLTPNLMVTSSALFVFAVRELPAICRNQRIGEIAARVESYGFGAYLVHVLFICVMTDFVGIAHLEANPLIWIPLLTTLICIASILTAALIQKIPGIGRIIA